MLTDILAIFGATLRITRLLTTDTLGEWVIDRPARKWANSREKYVRVVGEVDEILLEGEVDDEAGPRSKLVSGLECPFCVGTWIGFAMIGSYLLARRHRATLSLWRFVTAGLSLNYLTAHISSRID